jgi:hypothetical protein
MYQGLRGWAHCFNGFIWYLKQRNKTNKKRIEPVGAIVGLAKSGWENAAAGGIDSVWLVNHYVNIDTHWILNQSDSNTPFRCFTE